MIKNFIKKHCGEKNKISILIGFILLFLMLLTTILFTYHTILHIVALSLQVIFLGYNIFLFFKIKNKNLSFFIFIIPFVIAVTISLILNGYNSNYNTIVSEVAIFISIVYFAQAIPNKKDCFSILKLSLAIFVLYFLIVYSPDFISLLKTGDFSNMRFGDKVAPINMITIYFDLACSLAFLKMLNMFKVKKFLFAIILLLFYAVAFMCGVSTGSKQFIAVTVLANLVSLIWFFGKRRWYFSLATIASLTLISIFLLTLPVFSTIADRFKAMFDLFSNQGAEDYSSAERILMFDEAFFLFTTKPLFGYGLWGYALNGSYETYSHNTLSNILCELGSIGFITFAFAFFGPLILKLKKNIMLAFREKSIWIALLCITIQFAFGVMYFHKITFVIMALSYIYFFENDAITSKSNLNVPKSNDETWLRIAI